MIILSLIVIILQGPQPLLYAAAPRVHAQGLCQPGHIDRSAERVYMVGYFGLHYLIYG
jgi:hypothetical protein